MSEYTQFLARSPEECYPPWTLARIPLVAATQKRICEAKGQSASRPHDNGTAPSGPDQNGWSQNGYGREEAIYSPSHIGIYIYIYIFIYIFEREPGIDVYNGSIFREGYIEPPGRLEVCVASD